MPTVKTHINHIRRKLDQTTRVGAVLEYQRLMGLVVDGHEEHSPPSPPAEVTRNQPWV